MSPICCLSGGLWRDSQERRSRGRASIPRSIPEGEKLCVREGRQAGHGGARVVWVARSACGEAAGIVARASGPRGKASGRMLGGTTLVKETAWFVQRGY